MLYCSQSLSNALNIIGFRLGKAKYGLRLPRRDSFPEGCILPQEQELRKNVNIRGARRL